MTVVTALLPVEEGDSLPPDLLTEGEWAYLATLRHPRRHAESKAARLAAKWACHHLINAGGGSKGRPFRLRRTDILSCDAEVFSTMEVIRRSSADDARPRLLGARVPGEVSLSLAHAEGLAGAMVGWGNPVGLDIEGRRSKKLSPQEWSWREALAKTGVLGPINLFYLLDMQIEIFPRGGNSRVLRSPQLPPYCRAEMATSHRTRLAITEVEISWDQPDQMSNFLQMKE